MTKVWHSVFLRINEVLLDSCLCESEKGKIVRKINYHHTKLNG